jgi:hypothetical protein
MQARGLFGPRHVHKKVLELPFPKFEKNNQLHIELADLAEKCTEKVRNILPDILEKYSSIAYIRREVRNYIEVELERISQLTIKLLSNVEIKGKLESYFIQEKEEENNIKSKYDPILDGFIESERDIVKVNVSGIDANYLRTQLKNRIDSRNLADEIDTYVVNGECYLEKLE